MSARVTSTHLVGRDEELAALQQRARPGGPAPVAREFDLRVALDCWALEPGRVAVGDDVRVVALPRVITPPAGNGKVSAPALSR
jgi:hypothetical protein